MYSMYYLLLRLKGEVLFIVWLSLMLLFVGSLVGVLPSWRCAENRQSSFLSNFLSLVAGIQAEATSYFSISCCFWDFSVANLLILYAIECFNKSYYSSMYTVVYGTCINIGCLCSLQVISQKAWLVNVMGCRNWIMLCFLGFFCAQTEVSNLIVKGFAFSTTQCKSLLL